MKHTYGFIGCGNMGGALASAVSKTVGGENIAVADFNEKRAAEFAAEIGASPVSNAEIAKSCKYIFLGVKPQMISEMLDGIKDIFAARKNRFVLVSMAAGISCEKICKLAGGEYPVIRIMPNIPVSVGKGMILYCTNGEALEIELEEFLTAMSRTGTLCALDEHLIDAGSAISGCGPAYVFMFIEALADGGVECGLPRDKAITLAAQTLLGASALVLESGKHPGALKDAVCSPGGSTIAGVRALEQGGFRAATADAVLAAFDKTKQLGKN